MKFCIASLCVCLIFVTAWSTCFGNGYRFLPHSLHKRQADSEECQDAVIRGLCLTGYYEEYAKIVYYCGQSDVYESIRGACRQNSAGAYCGNVASGSEDISDAYDSSSDSETCSSGCMQQLNTARNTGGCCVSFFNSTACGQELDNFGYSLWTSCGVEPVTE